MTSCEREPEEFFYGYGYAARYLRLSSSESRKESAAVRFLRRGIAFLIGFDIVHAFRNRAAVRRADAGITHAEHEHLAIALLQRLRIVRDVKVVGQSIWIRDSWGRISAARRALYRWLLREIALYTVHSPVSALIEAARLDKRTRVTILARRRRLRRLAATCPNALQSARPLPSPTRRRPWPATP